MKGYIAVEVLNRNLDSSFDLHCMVLIWLSLGVEGRERGSGGLMPILGPGLRDKLISWLGRVKGHCL
ncbi:hypothetical protein DAI22_01g361450 [Oryza sativa Japonica Group]|jgi:hypothetical protein|nr:hypothetical protein DAI22_01g361450 [Oryza sativa Japonica Group]